MTALKSSEIKDFTNGNLTIQLIKFAIPMLLSSLMMVLLNSVDLIVVGYRLGENDIFGENGKIADGAITVEITERSYSSFEFKLTGFNDDNKDKALALGAYVKTTKGESTEYSYMQMGTPAEGAKYVFMSYTEYLSFIKA